MKYLYILFFCVLVISKPIQAQNVDLSEDIAALREDIKSLEAEIAEAKASYPEDVPELQQELATMKKMLASFEKLAGMSSAPPPAAPTPVVSVKPKSTSPVVPINLNQPVKTPTPDQSTDQFLGQKGRKINDSTFITSKGLLLQFQLSQNRLVCQPDSKSDPFKHIVDELEKSEQRKDELIDNFSKMQNGVLYYPQLIHAVEYYSDMDIRFNGVVNNTIDLPPARSYSDQSSQNTNKNMRGGPYAPEMEFEDNSGLLELKQRLQAAREKFKALPSPETFPSPPQHDLSICGSCDEKIVKRERKLDSLWYVGYKQKEEEIIREVLSVYHDAVVNNIEIDENDPQVWACGDAIDTVMKRMTKKNDLLIERYGKDLKRSILISTTLLSLERQKALLGVTDDGKVKDVLDLMKESDKAYLTYFKERLDLKDYNFVYNIGGHLGRERQKQILGVVESGGQDPETKYYWNNVVMKAASNNRFALTLDLDFIYEQVDHDEKLELRATGSITTKDKVFVSLYPDSCSWRMILSKVDYNNASDQLAGIPLHVKSGEKTVRDEDDNLVTFSHTGTKEMVAYLPDFKINLCDVSKRDSALMMPINLPYGTTPQVNKDFNKSYKDEMVGMASHMFTDVNKMEDNESEGMDLAADIIATLSESNVTEPTGNPKLDKMQREYNIKVKQDDHKKDLSQIALTKKSVFLFNANNGSTVFIDQTNDTKHRIDEYAELKKGSVHMRVVHDPEN